MSLRLKQNLIRIISSISCFFLSVYLTPNFNLDNFGILVISSLFVVILDYLVSTITNIHDYPIGRGIIGFFSAVVIIFATQFFISGYTISLLSSIIVALIYFLVDYCLPNK